MGIFINPNISRIRVRSIGRKVILEFGKKYIEIPYEQALELSSAIRIQAKKCEEIDKANEIIMDSAILKRVGAPIGLSSNPDIQKEAIKESLHNKKLRKYITPGKAKGIPSIQSGVKFGRPKIKKENPV